MKIIKNIVYSPVVYFLVISLIYISYALAICSTSPVYILAHALLGIYTLFILILYIYTKIKLK